MARFGIAPVDDGDLALGVTWSRRYGELSVAFGKWGLWVQLRRPCQSSWAGPCALRGGDAARCQMETTQTATTGGDCPCWCHPGGESDGD